MKLFYVQDCINVEIYNLTSYLLAAPRTIGNFHKLLLYCIDVFFYVGLQTYVSLSGLNADINVQN